MIKGYHALRAYCHQHEWAAGLSAALLISLFGSLIFLTLNYQSAIWHWLASDLLINGLILTGLMLLIASVAMSLLCLSFGPCSHSELGERADYRHRPVLSETLRSVKNLGGNPKRRHTSAYIESS